MKRKEKNEKSNFLFELFIRTKEKYNFSLKLQHKNVFYTLMKVRDSLEHKVTEIIFILK